GRSGLATASTKSGSPRSAVAAEQRPDYGLQGVPVGHAALREARRPSAAATGDRESLLEQLARVDARVLRRREQYRGRAGQRTDDDYTPQRERRLCQR